MSLLQLASQGSQTSGLLLFRSGSTTISANCREAVQDGEILLDPVQSAQDLQWHTGAETIGAPVPGERFRRDLLEVASVLDRSDVSAYCVLADASLDVFGHKLPMAQRAANSPIENRRDGRPHDAQHVRLTTAQRAY